MLVVSVKGKAIELTPKEYDLLCLCIANRGKPLRREFIRKTIWKDARIHSWSRVIDVHIQHLRQKIEKNHLDRNILLPYREWDTNSHHRKSLSSDLTLLYFSIVA